MLNPPHITKNGCTSLLNHLWVIDPCYNYLIFTMSLKHDIYVHVFPGPTIRQEERTNLFKGQEVLKKVAQCSFQLRVGVVRQVCFPLPFAPLQQNVTTETTPSRSSMFVPQTFLFEDMISLERPQFLSNMDMTTSILDPNGQTIIFLNKMLIVFITFQTTKEIINLLAIKSSQRTSRLIPCTNL